MLGSSPLVQVTPLSVEVAQPMLSEPPSVKRPPPWNVPTMVLPKENVSGSSSAFVRGPIIHRPTHSPTRKQGVHKDFPSLARRATVRHGVASLTMLRGRQPPRSTPVVSVPMPSM